MYANRLQQVDGEITGTASLNSTRLTDKLLEHFPDTRSQSDGHDVLLVFDDDIGTALFKACSKDFDQDAICLSRAAKIVRRQIFGNRLKWSFNGSFKFSANCNDNSVDTDVVVQAIAFQQKMACLELWVALGTGQNLRYIPAHELACILGPERACAPKMHASSLRS